MKECIKLYKTNFSKQLSAHTSHDLIKNKFYKVNKVFKIQQRMDHGEINRCTALVREKF